MARDIFVIFLIIRKFALVVKLAKHRIGQSYRFACKYICLYICFAACIAATLTACSNDTETEPQPAQPIQPQIVFLFSPGGLGDMSYNDRILEGVQQFKSANPEIDTYIYSPNSLDEAEKIFSDWLVRPESSIPVLFVLASSDYEPMADKHLAKQELAANKSILLFESRRQYSHERIHTFQISMYGASYLAGVTAAHCVPNSKSLIVLANNSDGPTAIAKDGFLKGYGAPCAKPFSMLSEPTASRQLPFFSSSTRKAPTHL